MLTRVFTLHRQRHLILPACLALSVLAVGLLASLLWPQSSRPDAASTGRGSARAVETVQPLAAEEADLARGKAARFLAALGRPAAQPTDVSAVDAPLLGARWRVSYGSATTVEIDSTNRTVVYFFDRGALAQRPSTDRSSSERLTDADVTARARESLDRLGAPLEESQIAGVMLIPQGNTPLVLLRFPRVVGGYPFWDDSITVGISRQDGSLYSYHRLYRDGHVSGAVRIEAEEAAARAARYLETSDLAQGFRAGSISSVLMYVRPNDYWTPRPRPVAGEPRLAFVVRLRNADPARLPIEAIVWIDAEDGSPLGGTRSQ